MSERSGAVTMKGNPLTLTGNEVSEGDAAPDVTLVNNDLQPAKISDWKGKVVVLASVPSLDTPVCDMETRRFNSEATGLGDDVVILTVSMDLPFAQKRWCGANGVKNVITLSDYQTGAFGEAYGVMVKEIRLLARAVFVLDRDGKIQYQELVKEIAEEPDYNAAIAAVKKLT
jgi:thiol peroxidase